MDSVLFRVTKVSVDTVNLQGNLLLSIGTISSGMERVTFHGLLRIVKVSVRLEPVSVSLPD